MPQRAVEEPCPGVLVHVVRRILLATANLVDDDPLLLGEPLGRDDAVEALLGEQRERLLHVVVEDLEVEGHVLVARVRIVLTAELGRAAVERHLIQPARTLEEHVLGHVSDARMPAVEAGARAHHEGDRGERPRNGIVEHDEGPVTQAVGLAEASGHGVL